MDIKTLKAAVSLLENMTTADIVDCKPAEKPIGEVGRSVIVRSRDAGVIYGKYQGNDGDTVSLSDARQLWKWSAAKGISLIDVATHGVKKSDCKFSDASATVTVFNACALIEVLDAAAASIEAV